jgi:hypothetical protein
MLALLILVIVLVEHSHAEIPEPDTKPRTALQVAKPFVCTE